MSPFYQVDVETPAGARKWFLVEERSIESARWEAEEVARNAGAIQQIRCLESDELASLPDADAHLDWAPEGNC